MTIKNAIEEFLLWKGTHMDNPKTYGQALRPLIDFCGSRDTKEIDIQTITSIVSRMQGSTFMFLTVLKVFSRYCHWAKIEFVNPHLIIVKRSYDPVNRKELSENDIAEMLTLLQVDTFLGVRNSLILNLLKDTGMRLSELLSLKVSDMDGQNPFVKILTEKSKINRYVAWTGETHRLLQTYLGMRVSKDWRTDKLFLGTTKGAIFTSRGVQHMFSKLSEEALNERHHVHELRHFKAKSVLKKGGDVFAVKTILGHKSLQSALTYLRLQAEESLKYAVDFVS